MNNKIKDTFLLLLKMGLWGESPSSFSDFPLNEEEWSLIYGISQSQTVEGIVYEGILSLPKEFYPSYHTLIRWTAKIDSIERYNKTVRQSLSVLADGLNKNKINFVLLKGLGLAHNYSKPLLRVSGDIDLYFPSIDYYHQANNLLKERGYKIQKGDHNSVFYIFNTVEVEHHTRMVDIFNPFCQKFLKTLIATEAKYFKPVDIEGQKVFIPSTFLNLIQANAHILKHYMGFGFGLRQVCDIARLYYTKEKDFDGMALKEAYAKLGMAKWMNLMHNLLVKHIGLDASYLPYPIEKQLDAENLLKDILTSGNFGFHDTRFRGQGASMSERYYKRDNIFKRVIPHLINLLDLTPSEVLWFPLSKVYTKLTGR